MPECEPDEEFTVILDDEADNGGREAMPRRRAMSSERASEVRVSGLENEEDFAYLIGGRVVGRSSSRKADVLDIQGHSHSVKAGTWSQVFLYSRDRLLTDTVLAGIGDLADILVACLDAFPETYADFLNDEEGAKSRLQMPMRRLRAELNAPNRFTAFLEWSIFDGGNVDYLTITPGPANRDIDDKVFHIFDKREVINALAVDIQVRNSRARRSGETDAQKVTFKPRLYGRNIGELEERHDSRRHYREMKFRLNAIDIYEILEASIARRDEITDQLVVYGNAIGKFRPAREGEEIWHF